MQCIGMIKRGNIMGTGTINSKRRYLNSLKNKHRALDKEISLLYSKFTNDDTVNQMKREKLNLKTQIANLETELQNA